MEHVTLSDLIMASPSLLRKTGKTLNTLRLLCGNAPEIKINGDVTCVYDDTTILVENIHETRGVIADTDFEIDLSKASQLIDVDFSFNFDQYFGEVECVEDVINLNETPITIYDLMCIETTPVVINALPSFDHMKIKYMFGDDIYIKYNGIENFISDIVIKNNVCHATDYGYVVGRQKYPFSMFHSYNVNQFVNDIIETDIAPISNKFSIIF